MGFDRYVISRIVNSKFVCTGNFCLSCMQGQTLSATQDVRVPQRERRYLIYIFTTMISAPGGDSDQHDTVFADIYSIDGFRRDSSNGFGGV